MPAALPIGMATVSATMATIRRSSLTASRRSRLATRAALRRSSLGQLMVVLDDGEVDVLQGRQLAQLAPRRQARTAAQLGQVADGERATGGHDADLSRAALDEVLGLFHAVRADDERAAG